ncbi:chaperonin 10-like protein [Neohortaea acidophila]|uniref:Chaperonin 10-like protein n=1 Tax=Neohortaea acidophila TaxID=245834 RepID=A0A6A6PP08_9PEZI|nr:chaperonin 10-like protein [Neohortaea acidophila]KAF2481536.1 chaperonin 10-like protein [Neohortaea acidophila]
MNEIFKPKNVAAWQLKKAQRPLVVSKAPYISPPKDHVTIKIIDVAVNPIDWILQDSPPPGFDIDYPAIFGRDAAGEILEVGDDVKDFRVGQRVIANTGSGGALYGGFQKYALVHKNAVAELPYSIPTSKGVVLPLGISTASAGLFQKDFLALPFPKEDFEDLGRVVIVWGGSSSVGSCAIQLAVAAGAEVITTASAKNFGYVKRLGAKQCFDYHDDDVEDQIVEALNGRTVAGAYHAVGADGAVESCARIVDRTKGKAIVVTVRGAPEKGVPDSVRVKQIAAANIFTNEIGPYIWRKFLPKALESGMLVPEPSALIVGEELRSVQAGLDAQKKGVSAQKVVITNIS